MLKGRDKIENRTTMFIISGNHIHLQRWYENERWFRSEKCNLAMQSKQYF